MAPASLPLLGVLLYDINIDLLVPSVPGREKGPGFECNAGKARRARRTEREHKGPILVL